MMRILQIAQKPLPVAGADVECLVSTIAALGKRGHEVTLSAPRTPSSAPQRADTIANYYGVPETFRVTEQPLPEAHPFLLSYRTARATLRDFPAGGYDAVITTRLEIVPLGLRKGAPMVYDHYRLWGDQYPVLRPFLRRYMRHPRFLGALLHSEPARDSLARIGVPADRLAVAMNGFSTRQLEPRLGKEEARTRLGLPPERPIACYTGRLDRDKGIEAVIDMADLVPEVLFVLVGSRGEGPTERAAASRDNVQIVPWQEFSGVSPYLFAADVLLIPPSIEPMRRYGKTVLPIKTFVYMAAGRPILAPRAADTAGLLVDGETAHLVPPDDTAAAAHGLRDLLSDERRQARLATAAMGRASGLTWDDRAEAIERFLEDALERVRSVG